MLPAFPALYRFDQTGCYRVRVVSRRVTQGSVNTLPPVGARFIFPRKLDGQLILTSTFASNWTEQVTTPYRRASDNDYVASATDDFCQRLHTSFAIVEYCSRGPAFSGSNHRWNSSCTTAKKAPPTPYEE